MATQRKMQRLLAELDAMAAGRHKRQETLLGRYQQCADWKQAVAVLQRALSRNREGGARLPAPPGWLPPTL